MSASRGGKSSWNTCKILNPKALPIFAIISKIKEKLCEMRYIMSATVIESIFPIKVERKNTIASNRANFKKVKKSVQSIREVISIPWLARTPRYTPDCNSIMSAITPRNPKYFHKIKSLLRIGLERIRKIVFPSISLKRSWLPTNKTEIRPKTSIIARPKSTITLFPSPIVSFPRARENRIKTKAKKTIRYKKRLRTISKKVFFAIFSIRWKSENM